MADNYQKLTEYKIEIDKLFKRLNELVSNDVERLIAFKKIVQYYEKEYVKIFERLFDAKLNIDLDITHNDLNNLRQILEILIKLEKLFIEQEKI